MGRPGNGPVYGQHTAIADCHDIALMDLHTVNSCVAHGVGDLGGPHAFHLRCHIFKVFLRRQIRNKVYKRRNSLRHRSGRDHNDLLILRQITGLVGCQNDIFIVGEDENGIGIDLCNGI